MPEFGVGFGYDTNGTHMDNGNEPATKGDIQQLRSEFQHGFDELKESMRDGQTELLRAFYSYTQSNNERLSAVEQDSVPVRKRLAILESRITEVEKRLNLPPSPQS